MEDEKVWLRNEWGKMRQRIVARITQREADMTERPLYMPVSNYTDVTRFNAEKQVLFTNTPLLAGFSGELPEAGSVMLFDGAGPGVFIVRRADGSLGAWLNFCPHRGARLVRDTSKRYSFSCPFHAWSFGHDGKLTGRPLSECFDEPEILSDLISVPIAEKYGMVFIRAMPSDEPIDVEAFLGPIAPLFESFRLKGATLVGKDSYRTNTNWKIALETGCEGYHVPATHSKSLAPHLVPFVTVHDSFGLHHRYTSPTRIHQECVGKPEVDWPETSYGAAHYIFPNIVFSYTAALNADLPVLALLRLFPGDHPGEALVYHNLYKPESAADQDNAPFVQLHNSIMAINQDEDLVTAGEVWRNYSRLPPDMRVIHGRNEMVLQNLNRQIADAIGMPYERMGGS